ncbi:MAG: glycosyltransferase family 4 protein [bacterium]|nr:glycosyltransferase family 4 protein [bacterium]
MKKLLIATDSFLPRWDGIGRFLNEVIPRLSKEYEIEILAPEFEGKHIEYENVKITRFKAGKLRFADFYPSLPSYRKIKSCVKEADVVWTHTIGPIGAFTIIAAKNQNKALVSTIHSMEWELFPRSISNNRILSDAISSSTKRIMRYLYNKCDLLMVPSREVGEILKKSKIKTQKRVVHLGTDTHKFDHGNKKEAKEKLGIRPETIVVGFCGRIGREKDLVTLYRGFTRLRRKHNVVLLIIGQDIANVTDIFKSKTGVLVFGSKNDVIPYLHAMDIYVLTSLTETSSLSTMEAMSCGIPPICTKVGYIKEYIQDGYNGFLFNKRDSFTLSKKMETLIKDHDLRKEFGSNARKTIQTRFSWDNTIQGIKEVIALF